MNNTIRVVFEQLFYFNIFRFLNYILTTNKLPFIICYVKGMLGLFYVTLGYQINFSTKPILLLKHLHHQYIYIPNLPHRWLVQIYNLSHIYTSAMAMPAIALTLV
jgi:hypothetical protein